MVSSVEEPLAQGNAAKAAGLVTSALDAVIVLDEEMKVVEWSDAAGELFGIGRAEAVGTDLVELIVPAGLCAGVRDSLVGGEEEGPGAAELLGRRIELPARRGDGVAFRAELTVIRAGSEGAGPTVFARDVSHRLEAERARAHMEQVVAGSRDAVFSKDLQGVVMTWNPAAERLYGYTAEEAIGRHVSFLKPEEVKREADEILASVRRGEHLEAHETRHVRKDGAMIDLSLTTSPIASDVGIPLRRLGDRPRHHRRTPPRAGP